MRLTKLIAWSSLAIASSFQAPITSRQRISSFQLSMENTGPTFPPSNNVNENPGKSEGESDEPPGQANTRFSKFAPDPSLSDNDFRATLKENMKADLERRRRDDPNRGNQPAKTYLDSL